MRYWLWRLLSKPEYFPPVPPHEFTPWLHPDNPCIYCGKDCYVDKDAAK